MKLDTTVTSETPEGLALVLRPAGAVPRAIAYAIDAVIRAAVYVAIAVALAQLGKFGRGILLIVYFGLEWGYPVLFELLHGAATPGKRALGLQVVLDDGRPVTPSASVVRNLLRTADFLPVAFFAGIVTMLVRPDFKRLGDLAAGTLVVHRESVRRHRALPAGPALAPPRPLARAQQLAVMRLAGRAGRLTPARLDELAARARAVLPPPAAPSSDPALRGVDPTAPGPRLLGLARWLAGQR